MYYVWEIEKAYAEARVTIFHKKVKVSLLWLIG